MYIVAPADAQPSEGVAYHWQDQVTCGTIPWRTWAMEARLQPATLDKVLAAPFFVSSPHVAAGYLLLMVVMPRLYQNMWKMHSL